MLDKIESVVRNVVAYLFTKQYTANYKAKDCKPLKYGSITVSVWFFENASDAVSLMGNESKKQGLNDDYVLTDLRRIK